MRIAGARIWGSLLVGILLPACGTSGDGTLTPTVAPAIPGSVQAFSGNRSVTVRWSGSTTGVSYQVKRSLTSGGPYFPIGPPVSSSTSTIDGGLTNGTTYFYVVSSSNGFGASADSAEARGSPGFTPISVATGCTSSHTLAILPDRTVWSWGSDAQGALGRGTTIGNSGVPVQVVGLTEATAVAVGAGHSLALRSDGSVWAWGNNARGELGQGAPSGLSNPSPLQVPGITGVMAVAGGHDHSVALRSDGTVWTWGDNGRGQLGIGTVGPPVASPGQVPGLTGVTAIAAGDRHTLAIRNDGSVWMWGANDYGVKGDGTSGATPVSSPVQVPNLTGIRAVSAGADSCLALRDDGTVWAWGRNEAAQLGTGAATASPILVPTRVSTLTAVTAIAAGATHALALRDDGTVWGWGSNVDGEQGNGTRSNTPTPGPVRIAALDGVAAITAGWHHSVALRREGILLAWGGNTRGEVGNGTSSIHRIATPVLNLTDVLQVAPSSRFAVALRTDGTVWAWGDNTSGQLGNGTTSTIPVITPGPVLTLSGVTAVSTRGNHCLALLGNGAVRAWGNNFSGQLGDGTFGASATTPVSTLTLTAVTAISAGSTHSLALKSDGTVWGWGSNGLGVLGTAGGGQSTTPIQVPGLTGITAISAGASHSLALRNDGTVWAWGWNGRGQIGQGSASSTSFTPVQVPGLTGVTAISVGTDHCLALSGGGVWAWGDNFWGQAGNGTATPVAAPTLVNGLAGVTAVDAGNSHSLALGNDGAVWAWGSAGQGALGTDGSASVGIPARTLNVAGPLSIAAGADFSLAVLADRQLVGWGTNAFSELAIPYLPQVLLPALISR